MKRTGIMGGTFDPIHMGHIEMARKAQSEFTLDSIIFVPRYLKFQNQNVTDARKRYEMVELAVLQYGFEISDIESRSNKPSFTFETLQNFHLIYPKDEFYFILGEDSLNSIEKWRKPELIFNQANIIVAGRKEQCGSESLRECIQRISAKYDVVIEEMFFENRISSTQIRKSFESNDPLYDAIPSSVCRYIKENQIY